MSRKRWRSRRARARIGSPKATPTGSRPRRGQCAPRGCAMWAPIRASGTMGTSQAAASAAAPGLNEPISPSFERVPSGKTSTGKPRWSNETALTEGLSGGLGALLRIATATPLNRERVEEEGGQAATPPDVEEVVGGRSGREVARRAGAAGHSTMSGASRWLEWFAMTTKPPSTTVQPLATDHGDVGDRPDRRLHHPALDHEARRGVHPRVEPVADVFRRFAETTPHVGRGVVDPTGHRPDHRGRGRLRPIGGLLSGRASGSGRSPFDSSTLMPPPASCDSTRSTRRRRASHSSVRDGANPMSTSVPNSGYGDHFAPVDVAQSTR